MIHDFAHHNHNYRTFFQFIWPIIHQLILSCSHLLLPLLEPHNWLHWLPWRVIGVEDVQSCVAINLVVGSCMAAIIVVGSCMAAILVLDS